MEIETLNDTGATLGEGLAWDAKTQTLYWVDILEKRVHYHREDEDGFFKLDHMPGCLAPIKDGTLLIAARASILNLEPASTISFGCVSNKLKSFGKTGVRGVHPAHPFFRPSFNSNETHPYLFWSTL